MNAGLIMSETHISQEISDITIFPLAVLAHHLLLLLSHADTNMSLHSLAFFVKHFKCLADLFLWLTSFKLVTPSDLQEVPIQNIYNTFTPVKLKIQTPQTGKLASSLITNSGLFFLVSVFEIFIQTEQHLVPTVINSNTAIGFSMADVAALPLLRGTSFKQLSRTNPGKTWFSKKYRLAIA